MIERTDSYRRVKAIAPEWGLVFSDKAYYLMVTDAAGDAGVIGFHPYGAGRLMVHIVFDKRHRGKLAAASILSAFRWVFENTTTSSIAAAIPVAFRRVHFLAVNVGMKFSGIEENVFRCYNVTKQDFEKGC